MGVIAMTTVKGWGPLPSLVRGMSGDRALDRILRYHDIPEAVLNAPHARIPLVKMIRIFEAAALETGAPDFGRRVGDATRLDDYGIWAAYAVGGRTLRDGWRRVCKTIWAHEMGSQMFLSERQDHVVWSYSTGFEREQNTRQFSDHLLGPMLVFVRAYLGAAWEPDWLEVGYAAPDREVTDKPLADTPVVYEQLACGLPVRTSELSVPIQAADALPQPITSPDLARYAQRPSVETLQLLYEAIELCLLDGSIEIDTVAKFLNLGPRTLQRRLQLQGVTFRELLQEVGQRRASLCCSKPTAR